MKSTNGKQVEVMTSCISTVEEFLMLVLRLPTEGKPDDYIPIMKEAARIAMHRCIVIGQVLEDIDQRPNDIQMEIAKHLAKSGGEA